MAIGRSKQVEAPEWFKLQRYGGGSPKNNADWLLQLGFRRDLRRVMHRVFSGGETAASLNAHHLAMEFVSKAWAMIHEDPIIDLRRLEQHFPEPLPYFPSLTILFERQPRNVMAVHPTTVGEHYEAELMLGPDFRSIGKVHVESIEELSGPPEFGTAPALKLNSILGMKRVLDRKLSVDREDVTAEALDHPLYAASVFLPSSLLFTVNWLLPDTLLMPQFKEALARSRAYFAAVEGEPPQLPSDPAKGWHELQLLAYLDLTAAELFPNARKRKRPEISALLWPNSWTAPKQSGTSLKAKKTSVKTPARTLKLLGPGQLEERLEADAAALMAERSQPFMILEARAAEDLADRFKDPSPPVQMERAISPPETRKDRKKKT